MEKDGNVNIFEKDVNIFEKDEKDGNGPGFDLF